MENKLCRGPFHPPGGELVLIEEFTFNQSGPRKGKPLSRCRLCRNLGNSKTVPSETFSPLLEVLLDGRTIAEVSKLVNLPYEQVKDLSLGKRKRIYKKTFLNIYRAYSALPKEKISIGPKNIKTKRNGLSKLSYEERQGLKNLVSVAQKKRYLIEKKLLKY